MSRLLTTEYVYSGAVDDGFNDKHEVQQNLSTVSSKGVGDSFNVLPIDSYITTQKTTSQTLEEQVHTISSSDDEEFIVEHNTIKENFTNMSSEESGDFEGFDDYTTYNSSDIMSDTSRKYFNRSRNYLKCNSPIAYNDSRINSEDAVEIADDVDEEIAIDEDGRIFYNSVGKKPSRKSQTYRCVAYTPNKRKKSENENYNAISPSQLKTPPDQIVEVNSDSTTNSLKQKRQQINNKFQLNLYQQNHKANNHPNKCSTESTSEFPLSSPSNPQQPRGGKYPSRPPLLKNTLPADSFERQLAMITTCNPQMTLAEKIDSWDCEEELSDLEDVRNFDEEFKRVEKQKKIEMKQRYKSDRIKNTELKNYDFITFRQMILNNIKEQKQQKFNNIGQGLVGISGVTGGKCVETSGSESSKSVVNVDDRPSTSAVAQQQLQQRRNKPIQLFEMGDPKKRVTKDVPRRNQNSTTPPQTSSSDYERDCFKKSKNSAPQRHLNVQNALICPSSSEEAISQETSANILLEKSSNFSLLTLKNVVKNCNVRPQPTDTLEKSYEKSKLTKQSQIITDQDVESFFRPHRLNRERDKHSLSPLHNVEGQLNSIIQLRLDSTKESKAELLMEKKHDLFKTPIIPQKKYFCNPLATEYQKQSEETNIDMKIEPTIKNSLLKVDEPSNKILQDKVELKSATIDDLDGVYHQQHEFCNYLGLTGMSTATAMANAVAELAQCNLARRSMRVLRQQQQERRDKSAKEDRLLAAPKLKQLKEIRKRSKRSCDMIAVIEAEQSPTLKTDKCSHSQASELTSTFKETKKKTTKNTITKSSTKSQNSSIMEKKEPEIKLLRHLAVKNKKKPLKEKSYFQCVKEIEQPVRETLMRQSKQRKSDIVMESEENTKEMENNKTEKTDIAEDIPLMKQENATSKSPILSTDKSLLKNDQNRSKISYDQKGIVQSQETSIISEFHSMCDTGSVAKSNNSKSASQSLKIENLKKDENASEHCDEEEMRLSMKIHLVSSAPCIIQKKLQIALEESRKSKPSIFIVQSLDSKKEKNNNLIMESVLLTKNNDTAITPPPPETQKRPEIKNDCKASPTKYNKNDNNKVLRKHKGKKYPVSRRQLRKRKIIVIKTLKPKHKSYEGLNIIKRELRSSPRINDNQKHISHVTKNEKFKQSPIPDCTQSKSFRTVHTETKDLEFYLDKHNNNRKTQIMAKASVLLERSRRKSLRGGCSAVTNKTKHSPRTKKKSKLNLHGNDTQILKPSPGSTTTRESRKIRTSENLPKLPKLLLIEEEKDRKQIKTKASTSSTLNTFENENVVVSSTTNTYDERPSYEPLSIQSPITLRSSYVIAPSPIKTNDQTTQCGFGYGIHYLNTAPLPIQAMRNPLKSEYGAILYIYNELDILIVIQENLVSFYKYSKLINMLMAPSKLASCTHRSETVQQDEAILLHQNYIENCCNNLLGQPTSSSTLLMDPNDCNEWILLGELRRLNFDFEISVPYANRICLHNSTPIYLEMRAKQLPKNQRDCNLLSIYINIYYYHDEDMIAKCNSIPLDSIQSDMKSVNYTTLTDSRYFIITWPQENLLGKTRSGLCKYSLTPQLDTLASIRDFKSMRHTIRYLECMSDDKLIGFGETQVSIWDYRSGDVLMNFDLEIPIGKNLGSIYFSSQDIEQNNMLILHQFANFQNNTQPELITIACTVSHTQPSYKVLQKINLPTPAFKVIKSAIKTADHLVVIGHNDDELWISLTNPKLMTVIPNIQNSKRFYSRDKSHLIELTEKTLNVNSLANHILQLAAGLATN